MVEKLDPYELRSRGSSTMTKVEQYPAKELSFNVNDLLKIDQERMNLTSM